MPEKTSAPGKIILLGEHAVVYGIPAVAVPLSTLRVTVSWQKLESGDFQIIARDLKNQDITLTPNLDNEQNPLTRIVSSVLAYYNQKLPSVRFEITSDLPIASGLGSGAAVSTALGRAVANSIGEDIPNAILNEMVYNVEKIHHGTPSGIDNTVIVYEQSIKYKKDEPIESLRVHTPFTVLVADTGVTALTHQAVGDVRKLYQANQQRIQSIFNEIDSIVVTAIDYIGRGQIKELGKLMYQNHKLLQKLTVSSPKLDHLVEVALSEGALGAKLSGGGRGGNMIALVEEDMIDTVGNALSSAGATRVFHTDIK